MFSNKNLILLLLFMLLPSCKSKFDKVKHSKFVLQDSSEPITLMIHGTWFPGISSYIFKMNCPLGLVKINELESDSLFLKSAQILYKQDPKDFDIKNFYNFGWSGILSFSEREKAALELYKCLLNYSGPITIIAHSHGCNLALNLAKIAQQNNNKNFVIDRLILLACPVQEETKKYVDSEIFKEIYHFYSKKDLIQVIDPQGLYAQNLKSKCSYFSGKCFNNKRVLEFSVQDNKYHLKHNDFWNGKFFQNLPNLLKRARNSGQNGRNSLNLCTRVPVAQ